MNDLLTDFPVTVEIPVAWGEMDAFQHVNNAVYFRYFETGRIAYLREAGFDNPAETNQVGPILSVIRCRFRFPLTYPDTITVGLRVTQLAADRLTMLHRVVSRQHQKVAAEGEGVVVSFDYGRQQKTAVPDAVRKQILAIDQPELVDRLDPV